MTFKTTIQDKVSNLWMHHLPIPTELNAEIQTKKLKRIICAIDSREPFAAGLMGGKTKGYYIVINKERFKKFSLQIGQQVTVEIKADESKYGIPMPDVFQAFLDQDPDFDKLFHDLTPGKQRTLLYLVVKMKSEQKQIEKTTVIATHLKKMHGKIDYKILNQDFKDYNAIMRNG